MMHPRGIQPEPGSDAWQQVGRSFLVVRIVRGSLLVVFLGIALVGVESKGWPTGVAVAVGAVLLLQLGSLASSVRTFARLSPTGSHDVAAPAPGVAAPCRVDNLVAMPENENELDPGAPTEMFQAFVDRPEPEATRGFGTAMAVASLIGLLIMAAIVWFVLRA